MIMEISMLLLAVFAYMFDGAPGATVIPYLTSIFKHQIMWLDSYTGNIICSLSSFCCGGWWSENQSNTSLKKKCLFLDNEWLQLIAKLKLIYIKGAVKMQHFVLCLCTMLSDSLPTMSLFIMLITQMKPTLI